MAERRMSCWNCPRYDREALQCREGKTNPKQRGETQAVAEALGIQKICHYNPYRDGIAIRMYFPNSEMARVVRRKRSRRPGKIDVIEILEGEATADEAALKETASESE